MCNTVSRSLGREGVVRCSSSWLAGVATANYMCTTCPLDIFAQVMRGGRRKVRAVVVKLEYPVFLERVANREVGQLP